MNKVFDQEFMRRLENLELVSRKLRRGKNSGERRSLRKGSAVEFADYRNYSDGDDTRYIDWNSYARSEKLFIKLFMEEQDLLLNILIDTSASMDWGEPPKSRLALQLAAALGWLAISAYDRVSVAACNDHLVSCQAPLRGKGARSQLWDYLGSLSWQGKTDLNTAIKEFGPFCRGAGLTFVISDLLSPAGFKPGLQYLQYLGQEVVLLQVLAPDELNPVLGGDYRLIDHETQEMRETTVNPVLLQAYQRRLREFTADSRDFCVGRGMSFMQINSAESFADVILRYLPQAGILK
ncbi:DUF58 domain-containing protein [Syntrophomonas palmitatica]|uniref:DUF58 domain-containing protein n=1 Tax=Syntrophomonas palmitatica TaxID=402877 RepID=UPI0006D0F9FA|nr:DUF58 domain-containing protein [Syntrophomonas palmitatica]